MALFIWNQWKSNTWAKLFLFCVFLCSDVIHCPGCLSWVGFHVCVMWWGWHDACPLEPWYRVFGVHMDAETGCLVCCLGGAFGHTLSPLVCVVWIVLPGNIGHEVFCGLITVSFTWRLLRMGKEIIIINNRRVFYSFTELPHIRRHARTHARTHTRTHTHTHTCARVHTHTHIRICS